MKIVTDNIEVFEILARAEMEKFDPAKSGVLHFFCNETWNLFLFCPDSHRDGKFKGCRLYSLKKSSFEIELREKLLVELISLSDDPEYFFLKNEALKIVETLIRRKKKQRNVFRRALIFLIGWCMWQYHLLIGVWQPIVGVERI